MMITPAAPAVRNLAQWLLLHETVAGQPSETNMRAAFRVCEKLRRPLSTLAGAAGSRSLISRSLALARSEVPWLSSVQIKEDGSLAWHNAAGPQPDTNETARGGITLVSQLLGLLATFIGEPLMLRLVRDVWPEAPYNDKDSGGEGKG